jgi:hypothetical protein
MPTFTTCRPNDVEADGERFTLWYVTVATRSHPNLDVLLKLCSSRNVNLCVLGFGDDRKQSKRDGYGLKLLYLSRFLDELMRRGRGRDLVLFTDAYDVLLCSSLAEIVRTYGRFGSDVVISGEIVFAENTWLNHRYERAKPGILEEEFPHLNSGVLMGTAQALSLVYDAFPFSTDTDDQEWFKNAFFESREVSGMPSIEIDTKGHLAISMAGVDRRIRFDSARMRFYDDKTGVYPCILHFDGPALKRAVRPYGAVLAGEITMEDMLRDRDRCDVPRSSLFLMPVLMMFITRTLR